MSVEEKAKANTQIIKEQDVSTAFHSAQHDTWWRGVKLRFSAKIVAVATATLTSAHCREPR